MSNSPCEMQATRRHPSTAPPNAPKSKKRNNFSTKGLKSFSSAQKRRGSTLCGSASLPEQQHQRQQRPHGWL